MFTIEQIKTAHAKVASGADFPAFVQEIIQLGVKKYETFVADGHTQYYGTNGYQVATEEKYAQLNIAEESNITQFKIDIKAHQQGKTNYITFCNDCARSGVEKWVVDTEKMTCTYYDKTGNEMLAENIPVPPKQP